MAILRDYWSLIKSRQTALLLYTGLAGFFSVPHGQWAATALPGLVGSLLLAISGATVLNMVYDRDIDAVMARTAKRPLAAGRLNPRNAALFGLLVSFLGVAWGVSTAPLFGLVVLAGWVLDVVVYTVWLKRRTAWSIIWGGLSGGMPVLAGRVLSIGHVDGLGILLALTVLVWIPTHILTFSIKYAEDYGRAGVPVLPNVYGVQTTQSVVGFSTVLAAAAMLIAIWLLALPQAYVGVAAALGMVLMGLAATALVFPSVQGNLRLFRYASVYMVASMGLLALGAG